jgi:hypothetical protein
MEICALKIPVFLKVVAEIAGLLMAIAAVLGGLTPLLAELRHWIF